MSYQTRRLLVEGTVLLQDGNGVLLGDNGSGVPAKDKDAQGLEYLQKEATTRNGTAVIEFLCANRRRVRPGRTHLRR